MKNAVSLATLLLALALLSSLPTVTRSGSVAGSKATMSASFVDDRRPDAWLLATGVPASPGPRGPFRRDASGFTAAASLEHEGPWWIYLRDKGIAGYSARAGALRDFEMSLPEAARRRRLRTGTLAIDATDLPVNKRYVESLAATGVTVRGTSRWLNAVSVVAGPAQLASISRLPFVEKVRPVLTYRRKPLESPAQAVQEFKGGERGVPLADPAYYNSTYDQLEQINVPAVHDLGFDGTGIIVCMLDTGFNLAHEAFLTLDVIGERDFIQGDTNTSNQEGDHPSQHNHGTCTMSTIGGFNAYEFVGGATGAQFVLAKTEIYDQEIQIEEDYYVMGLEYGDSLGATIVSSSLGYLDWYTYEDMDGETAVVTNAVDIAASKGITVVTAMGNEQYTPWHYLIAPADADSAVAVGAVDSNGDLTGFSSVGPTFDGRIKPDVVALGLNVSCVSPWDSTGYTVASGTSLATPLIASAAALLAQAHPNWGPLEIRDALRMSGDQSGAPDTARGWGLPDVLLAITGTADAPAVAPVFSAYTQPNPFNSRTTLHFTVGSGAQRPTGGDVPVTAAVYDVTGRLVKVLLDDRLPAGPHKVEWNGRDAAGVRAPSGVYLLRVGYPGGEQVSKSLLIR